MRKWLLMLAMGLLLAPSALLAADAMPPGGSEKQSPPGSDFDHTCLLHLPGIAGERWVDLQMSSGLRDAGYAGPMQTYDWTEHDPGLNALRAYKRNQAEAAKVAQLITEHFRADPNLRIILTAHSGGGSEPACRRREHHRPGSSRWPRRTAAHAHRWRASTRRPRHTHRLREPFRAIVVLLRGVDGCLRTVQCGVERRGVQRDEGLTG